MAKLVRLVLAVAAETLADTIETLQAMDGVSAVTLLKASDASDVVEPIADDDTPIDRQVARANAKRVRQTAAPPTRAANGATRSTGRAFGGRPKLYTPAATAAQIRKVLAEMDGKSLSALMLKTIADKKQIDKPTLRAIATKHGFNHESVDNVVWRQQKDGLVRSIEK